jgi:AraC-like DNA-binding protein
LGPTADRPSFPVSHLLNLIAAVRRWNVTEEELLAGSDIQAETLADPRARLPVPAMVALFERARSLTREPAIGLYIGLETRPTLYGNLGFALMSAKNIRESIDLTIRYGSIVTTALGFRLRVEGDVASLIVDERADLGTARDIVVLAALVSLRKGAALLAAHDLTTGVAELAIPAPSYAAMLAESKLPIRFDCPVHRLAFDARNLDVPYTLHDPVALVLARDHCQRELDRLGPNVRWAECVRDLLSRPDGGCRSLGEVAAALQQSTRTLKRRLAEEGVSFSALLDAELRERAMMLVKSSQLSGPEIAARLGYSNAGSFGRAFRRWTARTPFEYRIAVASPAGEMATPFSHAHQTLGK